MSTTKCLKFIRGRVARFTRLDACGRPIYGDASTVTTKGFVSVGFTANVDSGQAITVANAAGENCVNEPAVARLTGYTIEVQFCEVDPDIYALATGQATVVDAFGNVVGFDVDTAVSAADSAFALEVWAGAPSGSCTQGASGSYGYFLAPYLQGGTLGDFTIENNAVTFTLSNSTTKDGNAWGVGPYNVILDSEGNPSPLLVPVSSTLALRPMIMEVAPPEPQCGARPLLDPTDPALTSVVGTPDGSNGLLVSFAASPTGTDPWWIDFGDGTWDYAEGGGTISHTYAAAGTYAWSAFRGTSTKTGSLTVTP